MTLDGTKTNDLSYYQKSFIDTTQGRRSDKYQPISIIFEIESERSAKFNFESLPIRLHSTIRFSIDDNVNILTPCSKTIHTKFTKLASF